MKVVVEAVGEHAVRFVIPDGIDRRALLAHLRTLDDVADASVAAEHALVVFTGVPRPITLPASLPAEATPGTTHVVRVAYDGPDLEEVARTLGLSTDAVIVLHARAHPVRFLGFAPGFAYLAPVPAPLDAVVRRASPRARVPVGSVALAGGYTGIYPAASPGGWQLLGRAIDFDPFDGDRARFAVGDLVRFEPA